MTYFRGNDIQLSNDPWMQQQNQYYQPLQQQDQGLTSDWTMEGFGNGMKGLSSGINAGMGIANYFQNRKNFNQMMKLKLADFEEQKKAAALNASLEQDRINRHKGGGSSARATSWFDKVATV